MAIQDVSKSGDVQVGYDPGFEAHWAKFENIVRITFAILLVLGGVFGRGVVASAVLTNRNLMIHYDRLLHFGTPTLVEVTATNIGPSAGILTVDLEGGLTDAGAL